jgi:hypothetical protein
LTDGPTRQRIDAYQASPITAGLARTLRIWGDPGTTITGASMAAPTHSGADAGDSVVYFSLTWTSTSADIQIEFGAHIARSGTTPQGWGTGQAASFISGGPYHISLDLLDGHSTGAQDNQLTGSIVSST